MFYLKNKNHGFTLIEIMVVIGVIGILGSIAMNHGGAALKKARMGTCNNQMGYINRCIEQYNVEHGKYPDKMADLKEYYQSKKLPTCPSNGKYIDSEFRNGGFVECTIHGVLTPGNK